MQKSRDSGLATHIGPESCGAARKVVPARFDLAFAKQRSHFRLPFRIALRHVEILRRLDLFTGEQVVAAVRLVLDGKPQQLRVHIRKIRDGRRRFWTRVVLTERRPSSQGKNGYQNADWSHAPQCISQISGWCLRSSDLSFGTHLYRVTARLRDMIRR